MPNAPYAIRQKTEAALLAYIQSRLTTGDALAGTDLRVREDVAKRLFPVVIIECSRATEAEEAKGTGLYQLELTILIGTHSDEVSAATKHAARVGLISEWINASEGTKALLLVFLNAPTVGPDTRTVKGFLLYDILPGQEDGEQTGSHWMHRLVVTLIAQLQDE
jgi:hypothetical protein